jgi:hypothetical protein
MKGFVFSLCMVALFAANLSAGVYMSEQGILVSDQSPACANGVCTPLRSAAVAVARVATAPVRMVATAASDCTCADCSCGSSTAAASPVVSVRRTPVRTFVVRPVRSLVRRLGCCR